LKDYDAKNFNYQCLVF